MNLPPISKPNKDWMPEALAYLPELNRLHQRLQILGPQTRSRQDISKDAAKAIKDSIQRAILRSRNADLKVVLMVYSAGLILDGWTSAARTKVITEMLGKKPRKGASTFLLLMYATFELPFKGEQRVAEQKVLSSKARALSWANRQGYAPDSVERILATPGESLDKWARLEAKAKKAEIESERKYLMGAGKLKTDSNKFFDNIHTRLPLRRASKKWQKRRDLASMNLSAAHGRRKRIERAISDRIDISMTPPILGTHIGQKLHVLLSVTIEGDGEKIKLGPLCVLGKRKPMDGEIEELFQHNRDLWGE